jgi:hypothetical protein
MRSMLALITVLLLVQGCAKEVWHRQQVADWCDTWVQPPKQLLYCGSDQKWHYFKARPIDSWVSMKVDRGELSIADERPPSESGRFGFYAVDPADGFRKVPE